MKKRDYFQSLVVSSIPSAEELIQLPIIVVLNDNTCISHFMDYLVGVGGQNFIDFYLAIEVNIACIITVERRSWKEKRGYHSES